MQRGATGYHFGGTRVIVFFTRENVGNGAILVVEKTSFLTSRSEVRILFRVLVGKQSFSIAGTVFGSPSDRQTCGVF